MDTSCLEDLWYEAVVKSACSYPQGSILAADTALLSKARSRAPGELSDEKSALTKKINLDTFYE